MAGSGKKEEKIYCEGESYPYDHPRIYLEIQKGKDSVACPYCSKIFKVKSEKKK